MAMHRCGRAGAAPPLGSRVGRAGWASCAAPSSGVARGVCACVCAAPPSSRAIRPGGNLCGFLHLRPGHSRRVRHRIRDRIRREKPGRVGQLPQAIRIDPRTERGGPRSLRVTPRTERSGAGAERVQPLAVRPYQLAQSPGLNHMHVIGAAAHANAAAVVAVSALHVCWIDSHHRYGRGNELRHAASGRWVVGECRGLKNPTGRTGPRRPSQAEENGGNQWMSSHRSTTCPGYSLPAAKDATGAHAERQSPACSVAPPTASAWCELAAERRVRLDRSVT